MRTLDPATDAGAHALERLERELIGWLTTTNPDGQPQSSPVWFLWQDGEILLYSHVRAPRNANLETSPLVSFNLNSDPNGDEVLTMEGDARLVLGHPAASDHPVYVAKYLGLISGYRWTPESFAANYPVPILVRPTRWRLG